MPTRYEVRVEGHLGAPLVRYLGWSSRHIPEQTMVRIRATPSELEHALEVCTASGLTVDRVLRVPETHRTTLASS